MGEGKRFWAYEADLDWVRARKRYLTATDIVSLLPELKRVKKNGLLETKFGKCSRACIGLWAEKTSVSEPELYAPSQDAARGHVLEPYAVQEFSRLSKTEMKPWDDILIADEDRKVGFSPDALDILQPMKGGGVLPASGFADEFAVHKMLEVKSYGAKHHTEMLLEDKMEHKERYQIAAAMEVLPTIDIGALMFYNPSAAKQIIVAVYKREDLVNEIADVQEIIGMYNGTKEVIEKIDGALKAQFTEDQIYQEHVSARENLEEMLTI